VFRRLRPQPPVPDGPGSEKAETWSRPGPHPQLLKAGCVALSCFAAYARNRLYLTDRTGAVSFCVEGCARNAAEDSTT